MGLPSFRPNNVETQIQTGESSGLSLTARIEPKAKLRVGRLQLRRTVIYYATGIEYCSKMENGATLAISVEVVFMVGISALL
ncbi:unnamed protein product [Rhodiola kirilowii]